MHRPEKGMYHKESRRAATLVELLHEEELMREALSGFGWSQAEGPPGPVPSPSMPWNAMGDKIGSVRSDPDQNPVFSRSSHNIIFISDTSHFLSSKAIQTTWYGTLVVRGQDPF